MTDRSSLGESSTAAGAGADNIMVELAETAMANAPGNAEGDQAEKRKQDRSQSVEPELSQVDRLFSDRVVTILVGPHKIKWCLHENLLCGASDFFRSALNSGSKEALGGKIAMPEDDPRAFELFVRWLYIRAVATPDDAATSPAMTANALLRRHLTSGSAPAGIRECLRLYVLASRLSIEDLQNACVAMGHAYYGVEIRDGQVIYEDTTPASGMRKLMQDSMDSARTSSQPNALRLSQEHRLFCLNVLANVLFIAGFTIFHGAELTGTAFDSCQAYHQGRRGAGQCTSDVARLVSAYTMMTAVVYLFYHWITSPSPRRVLLS